MIIYKTTNKINNKIYVGKDSHNNPKYLGSGKLLNRSIKKYGIDNFIKEIIEYCNDNEQLNEREKFWIKELDATNVKIGYNIMYGGDGGDTFTNNPDKESTRKKISIASKKSNNNPETKRKIGAASKGNKYRLGTKQSAETKQKISESNKGKHSAPKSDETKRKIGEAGKGRKQSNETKNKRKESMMGKNKGKKRTSEQIIKMRINSIGRPSAMKGKHMSEEAKLKLRNANLGKKQTKETIEKREQTRRINKLNKNNNKNV
jgi:group I intron endonuclease